jgi:hypothetical protein
MEPNAYCDAFLEEATAALTPDQARLMGLNHPEGVDDFKRMARGIYCRDRMLGTEIFLLRMTIAHHALVTAIQEIVDSGRYVNWTVVKETFLRIRDGGVDVNAIDLEELLNAFDQ